MTIVEKISITQGEPPNLANEKGPMESCLNSSLGLELRAYFYFYVMVSDF